MKNLSRFLLGPVACALFLVSCNPMDYPSHLNAVLLNEHFISTDGSTSPQLTFTATPKRFNEGTLTVTWESNRPQVVNVSETGSLEALMAGFATITVTVVSKDVTVKDSCRVMSTSGDIYFPDPAFEAYCLSNFDTDRSGAVCTTEAAGVEIITCWSMGIGSLEGIEFFPSLLRLECEGNTISSLDLSYNHELFHLTCYENNLASLNLEQNSKLRSLLCFRNALTSLNVSGCDSLDHLVCSFNELSDLDLTHNTALVSLHCLTNNITSLDLSQNTALEVLLCHGNALTQLDLTNNTELTDVLCDQNSITTLDVSNCSVLNTLNCFTLDELWLKTGQTINNLGIDPNTEIKYK